MDFNLNEVESENTGWKPITPGLDIPAILESVEFAQDKNGDATEDLVFNFKGTADGNTGQYAFRIWANGFDTTDERFNQKRADWTLAQIKHIMNAYLPEEVTGKVGGSSWREFAGNIIKALNKDVIAPKCKLKIIYDKKNRATFPLFPDFIRTKKTPERSFTLNTQINQATGLPYESITPIKIEQDSAVGTGFGETGGDLPPVPTENDPF